MARVPKIGRRKMAKRRRKGGYWLARARHGMEQRGTVGKFGRATPEKIRRGLARGGKEAKRAAFAKAMRTIAARRRGRRGSRRRASRRA